MRRLGGILLGVSGMLTFAQMNSGELSGRVQDLSKGVLPGCGFRANAKRIPG